MQTPESLKTNVPHSNSSEQKGNKSLNIKHVDAPKKKYFPQKQTFLNSMEMGIK